jgi:Ku protein
MESIQQKRSFNMAATVWKGFISFGLVSFPVRLFAAARPETVHFHLLHKKDQSRVKEVWYCAKENKPIERSEIEKGYEVSKGEYVVLDDEELKKIAPPTATTMDVLQFVGRDDVDPIYFESSYYVAAEDKTAKPYVLFMAALTDTKQNAIAKVAMHNREHVVLLRPSDGGLVLHTLYYPDELHKANRSEAPKAKYSAKELELAKKSREESCGAVQAAGVQGYVPRECRAANRAEEQRPEDHDGQTAAQGARCGSDGSAEAQPEGFRAGEEGVRTPQGRVAPVNFTRIAPSRTPEHRIYFSKRGGGI